MSKRRKRKEHPQPDFVVNRQAQCVVISVDDPGYQRQHDGAKGNTRQINATINMRESPALWMRSHGWIDDAQLEAAGRIRKLYEQTQGRSFPSIDYLNEPVDGGKIAEPLTDARLRASEDLAKVRELVGSDMYAKLEAAFGQCVELAVIEPAERRRRTMSKALKATLEQLAVYWGFSNVDTITRTCSTSPIYVSEETSKLLKNVGFKFIYFIVEGDTRSSECCKVGMTGDLWSRLIALQIGNPRRLVIADALGFAVSPQINSHDLGFTHHNAKHRQRLAVNKQIHSLEKSETFWLGTEAMIHDRLKKKGIHERGEWFNEAVEVLFKEAQIAILNSGEPLHPYPLKEAIRRAKLIIKSSRVAGDLARKAG